MKNELQDIPKDFHSYETSAPFTHCIECGSDFQDGRAYLIEKAFKNHPEFGVKETVFDYALCVNCADDLKNEMSQESMAALLKYFADRMDFVKQSERMQKTAEENITSCMITDKHVDQCKEYQIYAYCVNGKISSEIPPYMISGEVMEEIIPLLSEKTTDDLNRFFNKHFAPDPTLMEPIGPRLVLV